MDPGAGSFQKGPVRQAEVMDLPLQVLPQFPIPVDLQRILGKVPGDPGKGADQQRLIFLGVQPAYRDDRLSA